MSERDTAAQTLAGLMAAVAIFAALVSLAYRPIRIDLFATLLALVAAGIGGRFSRLAGLAVGVCGVCFTLGMTIAVLTKHPLW